MVLAWSAMARVMACLIHHGIGRNLIPGMIKFFSTALIRPILAFLDKVEEVFPCPISLCNAHNKAQISLGQGAFLPFSSPSFIFMASSISSSAEKKRYTADFFKIKLYRIVERHIVSGKFLLDGILWNFFNPQAPRR